jgi:hypothetical protein
VKIGLTNRPQQAGDSFANGYRVVPGTQRGGPLTPLKWSLHVSLKLEVRLVGSDEYKKLLFC